MSARHTIIFAVFALVWLGCSTEIGDECETILDCSSSGSRLCDRTQPGGYCTVEGCGKGSCPEEAVCVKFRPDVERLAVTFCMYRCNDRSDCRGSEGYVCTSGDEFGDEGTGEAVVLDGASKKFCSIPAVDPVLDAGAADASLDGSVSATDAGASGPMPGDAASSAGGDR